MSDESSGLTFPALLYGLFLGITGVPVVAVGMWWFGGLLVVIAIVLIFGALSEYLRKMHHVSVRTVRGETDGIVNLCVGTKEGPSMCNLSSQSKWRRHVQSASPLVADYRPRRARGCGGCRRDIGRAGYRTII